MSDPDPEPDRDRSELLDDDVIDGDYPPDEPLGVQERLTPEEEQTGESLARRLAREEPDEAPRRDDWATDPDATRSVGPLVAPGEDGRDDEDTEVALEVRGREETSWDADVEPVEAQPAEEAAMHLTDPPPMGDGDGYVDADADEPVVDLPPVEDERPGAAT